MEPSPVRTLRRRLIFAHLLFTVVGVLLILGYAFLVDEGSERSSWVTAALGVIAVAAAAAYPAAAALRFAPLNRQSEGEPVRSRPGPANLVTLGRGVLFALIFGLMGLGRFDRQSTWIAAILYCVGLASDLLDGFLARQLGQTSMLGRHLENEVDSLCVAAASAYLVFGGRLPWYYLSIGVARYVFLLGVWIRSRLGLPVHPLRHSKSGRVLAGIQMNALLVALVPMVPVSTVPVGMAFATVPFLAGFARDFYGICTGRRPARALRERFQSYG